VRVMMTSEGSLETSEMDDGESCEFASSRMHDFSTFGTHLVSAKLPCGKFTRMNTCLKNGDGGALPLVLSTSWTRTRRAATSSFGSCCSWEWIWMMNAEVTAENRPARRSG